MNNEAKVEKLEKLKSKFKNNWEDYPCETPKHIKESLSSALLRKHDIEWEMVHLDEQIAKLEKMLPAEVIPFDNRHHDEEALLCPCCGGCNIHPTNTIAGIDENIRSDYAEYTQTNFWCEHCPSSVGLRMRFHKGMTYITWQINDETTRL